MEFGARLLQRAVCRQDAFHCATALIRCSSFHSKQRQLAHSDSVYGGVSFTTTTKQHLTCFSLRCERFYCASVHSESQGQLSESSLRPQRKRFLCYYFSQGLCTLDNDPLHFEKFTHDYPDLHVNLFQLKKLQPQPFGYYLVLDLEGRVEILEFPVVMIDARTLEVVDRFHRFVRPVKMSEARIDEYIEGKYGRWGLDRVWHDTAIPFTKVLNQFEQWLQSHGLWNARDGGKLKQAAFVTCGNWDVKTKIPEQCAASSIQVPSYFLEWVNLKDSYLNFYQRKADGMRAMLNGLEMPMAGTHHVGLDDAHNIARVLQRIMIDGGIVKVTAKRDLKALSVKFRFKNRIR